MPTVVDALFEDLRAVHNKCCSVTTEIYSLDERTVTSGNSDWMSEKM
jgi:hypothetical protein